MSETTTSLEESAEAPLLVCLLELLAAFRPAFRQERPYRRCVALVFGSLFAFARHTISQLLLTLGVTEQDWSGWYRLFSEPRVDVEALSAELVRETLTEIPAEGLYVVAVDGVQVPRWSLRMPGTSWLKAPRTPQWKPGIHWAQRYFHLAALLPITRQGYSRALPLRWVPAFPPKAVLSRTAPRTEGQAAGTELGWLRRQLDAAGRVDQELLTVADGSYDTAELWTALPPRTTLVARCAKNRALFRLPEPVSGPRRGAPRKYGERAPTPPTWLHARDGWQEAIIPVRGRPIPLRYRVEGPFLVRKASTRPLFLLVVGGVQRPRVRREPTFWLVSAVPTADGGWTLPRPAPNCSAGPGNAGRSKSATARSKPASASARPNAGTPPPPRSSRPGRPGPTPSSSSPASAPGGSRAPRSTRPDAGGPAPDAGPSAPSGAATARPSGTAPIFPLFARQPPTTGG